MLLVSIFQNSIRGRISGKKCNPNLEKVTRILLFFFPEQKIIIWNTKTTDPKTYSAKKN